MNSSTLQDLIEKTSHYDKDERYMATNDLCNEFGKANLLMANHGILTTGETVSDGFDALYYFEKSSLHYL